MIVEPYRIVRLNYFKMGVIYTYNINLVISHKNQKQALQIINKFKEKNYKNLKDAFDDLDELIEIIDDVYYDNNKTLFVCGKYCNKYAKQLDLLDSLASVLEDTVVCDNDNMEHWIVKDHKLISKSYYPYA